MHQKSNPQLTESLVKFITAITRCLPDDIEARLKTMQKEETDPVSRAIYEAMFENLAMAKKEQLPICQDTGLPCFYVGVGTDFPHQGAISASIEAAVLQATEETPLRPNVVEIFSGKNRGNNLGEKIPWIDVHLVPESSQLSVTVYMAGGGSSLPGRSKVLMPAEGLEGAARFVAEAVVDYAVNACPPILVGVGLGATADIAAALSKKAILDPVGHQREPGNKNHEYEAYLHQLLDSTGMGPQGLPGKTAIMDVCVHSSARHTATLAVGVSVGCWSHRRGTIIFDEHCNVLATPTHQGVILS